MTGCNEKTREQKKHSDGDDHHDDDQPNAR